MLVLLVGASPVASGTDDIALVGIDSNGNSVETTLSSDEYLKRLSGAMEAVTSSTLEGLRQTRPLFKGSKPWKVRTVVVGVGAELEAGVGPILKLKAAPRFKLAFSDSNDPALP
jgi:hypothetical protein